MSLRINVLLSLVVAIVFLFPVESRSQVVSVALLGDSNTWIGGEKCDNDRGWSTWFRKDLSPEYCRSFARSGATWTHTSSTKINESEYTEVISDDNVVSNQFQRLKSAVSAGEFPIPELIIVSAGTNDVWFSDRRPDALKRGVPEDRNLTLGGAVRDFCEDVKASFPKTEIIFLTPMFTTKTSDTDIRLAGDLIETAAKECGAYVIRLDSTGCIDPGVEKKHFTYTEDGVHTSRAGARRVGLKVASEVRAKFKF